MNMTVFANEEDGVAEILGRVVGVVSVFAERPKVNKHENLNITSN
jgi:hypothetical protein